MLSAIIPFCSLKRYSIMVSDGATQMSTLRDAVEFWVITVEHRISEVTVPSSLADNEMRTKICYTNKVRKGGKKSLFSIFREHSCRHLEVVESEHILSADMEFVALCLNAR